MLNSVCDRPTSFDVEPADAAACAGATAVADPPAAGCATLADGAPVATGFPPIPCFCNSISTRFFSASNCCKLETCTRGCDAGCAAVVAGNAAEPDAEAPSAASLAEGWIEPDHSCAPLAGAAAACEPATGADEAVMAAGATELAPMAALGAAETAGIAGATA